MPGEPTLAAGQDEQLEPTGTEDPEGEPPPRPRRRSQPIGQSIGGVLFGFEQQVWRNIPPPHELVHHARPDDPLPAGDGGFMTLGMPEPLAPAGPGAGAGRPEPEVRELPERRTVAVRMVGPMAGVDVSALVDRALPKAGARIEAAGLAIDGPPYVRYHDWGDAIADLEIGFPVAGDEAAIERLPSLVPGGGPGRSTLPGGPCIVVEHVGPYPDLPVTWGRLMAWMWERGKDPAGPTWESYIDNPDLVDHALMRTEVVRPIRR